MIYMDPKESVLDCGAIVNDRRTFPNVKPLYFIVATDSFMSGWGDASNRSLFCVPIHKSNEGYARNIEANMDMRSEFKRVRIVGVRLKANGDYWPSCRLGTGDHLSIVGESCVRDIWSK